MIIKNETWKIYFHVFPDNTIYIGITSQPLEVRWGNNGIGYKGQKVYEIIQQYDWNTEVEHILFADNLTKEEAGEMEKKLIKEMREQAPYTVRYNIADGGFDGGFRPTIQVSKYDLNGNFIATYSSLREALESVGRNKYGSSSKIADCCRKQNGVKSAYGFLWDFEEKENIPPLKPYRIERPVDQFDIEGNYIKTYINPFQAAIDLEDNPNANNDCGNIISCCNDKLRLYRGYQWRFHTDPPSCPPLRRKKSARIIDQFDLEDNYIRTFVGLEEIKQELKLNSWPDSILKVCNGKIQTAYGFKWKFNPSDIRKKRNYLIPVYKMNNTGKIIKKYNTMPEAVLDTPGARKDHIYECCEGKAKSHSGFIWRYVEE